MDQSSQFESPILQAFSQLPEVGPVDVSKDIYLLPKEAALDDDRRDQMTRAVLPFFGLEEFKSDDECVRFLSRHMWDRHIHEGKGQLPVFTSWVAPYIPAEYQAHTFGFDTVGLGGVNAVSFKDGDQYLANVANWACETFKIEIDSLIEGTEPQAFIVLAGGDEFMVYSRNPIPAQLDNHQEDDILALDTVQIPYIIDDKNKVEKNGAIRLGKALPPREAAGYDPRLLHMPAIRRLAEQDDETPQRKQLLGMMQAALYDPLLRPTFAESSIAERIPIFKKIEDVVELIRTNPDYQTNKADIALLDLGGLKSVNKLGYEHGDKLIIDFTKCIIKQLEKVTMLDGIVARVMPGQFMIILPHLNDPNSDIEVPTIKKMSQNIVKNMDSTYQGISIYPNDIYSEAPIDVSLKTSEDLLQEFSTIRQIMGDLALIKEVFMRSVVAQFNESHFPNLEKFLKDPVRSPSREAVFKEIWEYFPKIAEEVGIPKK